MRGGDSREDLLKRWENFVNDLNSNAPAKAGHAVIYGNAFNEVYRKNAILSTTLSSWAISNGLCLLIILLFTRNVFLSIIVMFTVILMVICLMGFVLVGLSIEFGPIEAIGVTIFVGLSANYALHVSHAYHDASTMSRLEKAQLTIFATGSPIMAAAISTIGACAFLLGCRLWLLVELGMMLCSNTATALIFSMVMLAILSIVGPLPFENNKHSHQGDFQAILSGSCFRRRDIAGLGLCLARWAKDARINFQRLYDFFKSKLLHRAVTEEVSLITRPTHCSSRVENESVNTFMEDPFEEDSLFKRND